MDNPRFAVNNEIGINEQIFVIAFDEVECKPNFNLWLSRGGFPVHSYMLKKSTFL